MADSTSITDRAGRRELIGAAPDAERLLRAYERAERWEGAPPPDVAPARRAEVAAALAELRRLEREIGEMRAATEGRWDRKTSAFDQADAVAAEDRAAWLAGVVRLAELVG
ncbi:MAG TPA: hypothetical protein VFQ38_07265 [Longimicrobiales bacterium]|nr:hypothetical protein [Longimicrobiales bacterium]